MAFEITKTMNGNIDFSSLNRELIIPINLYQQGDLIDIHLQIYCTPAVQPLVNHSQLTGGEDYRVYINDFDLTPMIISLLKKNIAEFEPKHIKKLYLKGAKSYHDYISSFSSFSSAIEGDWEYAKNYAEDDNWTHKFDRLGDRSVGWSGNLHCFNFIYCFIPLRPISLSEAWSGFVNINPDIDINHISDFDYIQIKFSQGPSPSSECFDPNSFHPSGRLIYHLELLHTNPLGTKLREIASQIKNINIQLDDHRQKYLTPIKSRIEMANQDIKQDSDETIRTLERLIDSVAKIG